MKVRAILLVKAIPQLDHFIGYGLVKELGVGLLSGNYAGVTHQLAHHMKADAMVQCRHAEGVPGNMHGQGELEPKLLPYIAQRNIEGVVN